MTRVHRWLVSGGLLFLALTGMLVLAPQGTLAATATITADIELRAGSGVDAIVVQTLPAGSVVSINGPPENGSYPVTFNGTSGWVIGSVLDITKDEVTTEVPADPAVDPAATAVATEVVTEPIVEPTVVPAAPEVPTEVPPVAPPVETALPAPPTTATAAPDDPAVVTDAPVATVVPEAPAVIDDAPVATETPAVPSPVAPLAPDPTATPEPTPTATPVPTGPATAMTDLNLRAGPTQSSGTLFLVSAGSTVWRTGSAENGYVSVDYMGIVGWLAEEYLAEPGEIIDEETPRPNRIEDDPREARPGSGIAFTITRLALREGPSANTPVITEMPARSRVTLTGVSENGFYRIVYKEQIGWASMTYLSLPESPTPAVDEPAVGGGNERPSYTEDQIVKIIYAAADRYDQPRSDMLRVAQCESGLDPNAVNPTGSYGLFQFVPSTWETTPYADENIFNPRANANAAAWMWSVGRRAEWVCQ